MYTKLMTVAAVLLLSGCNGSDKSACEQACDKIESCNPGSVCTVTGTDCTGKAKELADCINRTDCGKLDSCITNLPIPDAGNNGEPDSGTPAKDAGGAATGCAGGLTCFENCLAGECEGCASSGMCDSECTGGGCKMTCKGNATCDFSCTGGGCEMKCLESAACDMSCTGGGCAFTCGTTGMCDTSCTGSNCTGP